MPRFYNDSVGYNQAGYPYNGPTSTTSTASLGIGASILSPTKAIYVKADILKKQKTYLQARACVSRVTPQSIGIKGKVVSAAFLGIKADIRNTILQKTSIQASVLNTAKRKFSASAYIVYQNDLGMKASILNTVHQTLSIQAKVQGHPTHTISIKARLKSTLQTLGIQARVSNDLYIGAWISQRQGWPIPGPGDGNFLIFQPTQLKIRASILGPTFSTQSISAQARIKWLRGCNISLQGRVVTASQLGIKASIYAKNQRSAIRCQYSVQGQSRSAVRMVYYVSGNFSQQALGIGAYISRRSRRRFTGHFIVRRGIEAPISVASPVATQVHTLGMRAYIN